MVQAAVNERTSFSLEQATAMLPLLRLIVADIQLAHRELVERRLQLHRLIRRREGKLTQFHDDEFEETKQDVQTEARQLEAFIAELEKLGVLLRSAEDGIVAFPRSLMARLPIFAGSLAKKRSAFGMPQMKRLPIVNLSSRCGPNCSSGGSMHRMVLATKHPVKPNT